MNEKKLHSSVKKSALLKKYKKVPAAIEKLVVKRKAATRARQALERRERSWSAKISTLRRSKTQLAETLRQDSYVAVLKDKVAEAKGAVCDQRMADYHDPNTRTVYQYGYGSTVKVRLVRVPGTYWLRNSKYYILRKGTKSPATFDTETIRKYTERGAGSVNKLMTHYLKEGKLPKLPPAHKGKGKVDVQALNQALQATGYKVVAK